MKVIKRSKTPIFIAILAVTLALLITAAIIISVVINNRTPEDDAPPPIDIIDGEAIHNNMATAYPHVEEKDFNIIRIKGKDTEYALMRPKSEDPNKPNSFVLYYQNSRGEMELYSPAILDEDSNTTYESLYAVEQNDSFGRIYKLTYLCVAMGTPYFQERIVLPEDAALKAAELDGFGLGENDEPLTVTVEYNERNGEGAFVGETRKILQIGDKMITGTGYYFRIGDVDAQGNVVYRNHVYSSNSNYLDYAFANFTSYINPVITAAGLPIDKAFEPYLTTDYQQWVNTMHDTPGDAVQAGSQVIVNAATTLPAVSAGHEAQDFDGYDRKSFAQVSFNLKDMAKLKQYGRLIKALVGQKVTDKDAQLPENIILTLPSFSKSVALTNGASAKYSYKITAIESIITENGEITEAGAPVGDNTLIKVTYSATVGTEAQSAYAQHAVIDLNSALIPSDVKAAISAASVGALAEPLAFDIVYTAENSVNRKVDVVITEIIEIIGADGKDVSKVDLGTTVAYRYHFVIDGEVIDEDYTEVLTIKSDLTGNNKAVADAIMGKRQESKLSINAFGYVDYCEIFADFICYEINRIEYFVTSRNVVSFKYQQASERDPYYGESLYQNTTENEYRMYALNALACEAVVKMLGGAGGSTTASVGYVGLETVAVGINPETMKKYDLYDYTVYFELPRGITSITFDEQDKELEEYLASLDDYRFLDTLGFTLYISRVQDDGTRYIASDLYDTVTKVKAEDLEFLNYDFTEFYARRNLILTDISNVKNFSIDLFMDDVFGSYSAELTHTPLYAYGGKLYSKEQLTQQQLQMATEHDGILVYLNAVGAISDSEFKKYYESGIPHTTVAGKDYGVGLHNFYGGKFLNTDTLGTANFKEFMELIGFSYYSGIVPEEQREGIIENAPMLMRISVTLGEPYGDDYTDRDAEKKAGIYKNTSQFDYVYEFYRYSDRQIMVKLMRVNRITGEEIESVSDFYVTSFTFKKIVSAYTAILNKLDVDNDIPYSEMGKN